MNRGTITDPECFFGRTVEIETILERLASLQSTAIIGERCIGKSSLLTYLAQTGAARMAEPNTCFAYLDLSNARLHTANGFFQHALSQAGFEPEAVNGVIREDARRSTNLIAFTDVLAERKRAGKPVVLCLDEFENVFKHPGEFGEDFFDHLRSEVNQRAFGMITASKVSLQSLCLEGRLTSPFYNVFTALPLGGFTESEVRGFIAAYKDVAAFTDTELVFLFNHLEHLDRHPLRLQILCDWLVRNRRRGYDDEALAAAIGREYAHFFPSFDVKLWHGAKKQFTLTNIGKVLGLLKDGRELLTGKGDDKGKSEPEKK
jgi:hypothetical protein